MQRWPRHRRGARIVCSILFLILPSCASIIGVCWFAGSIVGFLPLLGWHEPSHGTCLFTKVMDYNYLVFLYFATIVFPALLLACFYLHIYQVVLKQLRRIVTMNPMRGAGAGGGAGGGGGGAGTMLRMLGPIKKSEVKATQNLSIIVLFFILCWFPLYTINCIQAFRRDWEVNATLMEFCIVLSHLNSAGNPLLYAYHLRDFRAALKSFLWKLLGVKEEARTGDTPGPAVRSLGSQLAAGSGRLHGLGVGGGAPGGAGGGAWAGAGTAGALRRSAASLHLLLAPPATPAANTAHSSMTSIASSMGSVHQAAAAPALAALPAPPAMPAGAQDALVFAHKTDGVRGKMSTVAEASQSEEEPSTTPAVAEAPTIEATVEMTTPERSPSASPPPLPSSPPHAATDGRHLDGRHLDVCPFAADAPARAGSPPLALDGALSDGDDEVFVPASAPNARAIGALRPGQGGSASASEFRPALLRSSAHRRRSHACRLHDDPAAAASTADARVDTDDRVQLSPRAAKTPVITNGNGDLRRAGPDEAAGAPARKLSPLKAVSDFLLGAKAHRHRDPADAGADAREEADAAARHHNGAVLQREAAEASS